MENETPGMDEQPTGMDRRQLIKRGAVVGGALVWTTPIVQSIAQPAFAQGSDGNVDETCVDVPSYVFKYEAAGLGRNKDDASDDTPEGFADDANSSCGNLTGTLYPSDSGIITITLDGDDATIVVEAPYKLTSLTLKSSNDDCASPTLTPTPAGCGANKTYVVSTITGQDISHIVGRIECEVCVGSGTA